MRSAGLSWDLPFGHTAALNLTSGEVRRALLVLVETRCRFPASLSKARWFGPIDPPAGTSRNQQSQKVPRYYMTAIAVPSSIPVVRCFHGSTYLNLPNSAFDDTQQFLLQEHSTTQELAQFQLSGANINVLLVGGQTACFGVPRTLLQPLNGRSIAGISFACMAPYRVFALWPRFRCIQHFKPRHTQR